MYTKITYVGTLNGVKGMWCGFLPEGVEVAEERVVLYPEEGKELVKGDERFGAVWLKDGDVAENYTEEDIIKELEEEPKEKPEEELEEEPKEEPVEMDCCN